MSPPAIESFTRNPFAFDPSPPENHVPERQTSPSLQRGRPYRCLSLHQIFNSPSRFPPPHRKDAALPKPSVSRVHRWEMEQLVSPLARSPVRCWLSTASRTWHHFLGFQVSVLSRHYFPQGVTRAKTSAQSFSWGSETQDQQNSISRTCHLFFFFMYFESLDLNERARKSLAIQTRYTSTMLRP